MKSFHSGSGGVVIAKELKPVVPALMMTKILIYFTLPDSFGNFYSLFIALRRYMK